MPKTIGVSPQTERVRALADQARNTSEGITVLFRVEKYGSLAACKTSARGMQITFSSIRVKARRLAQRLAGESGLELYPKSRGEYDDLACVVRPLPKDEGYSVALTPGYAFDMDLEVIDNSTGEPFSGEDPTQNKFLVLMGKWFKEDADSRKQRRERLNPFTTEELNFMWGYDTESCEEMNVPALDSNEIHDRTDYASVDLADLPEDELEIVNPGDA